MLGLLTLRFGVKGLTIVVMLLSTVMVALFGQTPPDLHQLSMICAAAGFCTNAAIVGMYAIIAQAFPTHVRASGTGFAVGIGRGGSVLAPIIAGFLFTAGYTLPTVAFMMSLGSLVAAGILSFLKARDRSHGHRAARAAGESDVHTGAWSILTSRTEATAFLGNSGLQRRSDRPDLIGVPDFVCSGELDRLGTR